jgi:succinate dehydrogenase flavin-adding protein (antitoxin of CptAB toxin-antitoxin module)
MKELDVLLERYVRTHLAVADSGQRQVLARFLELPDPLLADYLFGHAVPADPGLLGLVRSIAGRA